MVHCHDGLTIYTPLGAIIPTYTLFQTSSIVAIAGFAGNPVSFEQFLRSDSL